MGTLLGRIVRSGALVSVVAAATLGLGACDSSATPMVTYITMAPGTATSGPSASAVTSASPTSSSLATPTITSATISSSASDGRWTVHFVKPQVSGVPNSATLNAAIDARVDALINDNLLAGGLPVPEPDAGPSTLDGSYTVAYVSPTLISLRFSVDTYFTGAANGDSRVASINLVVATAHVIGLAELFSSPSTAAPVLSTQCQTRLAAPSALGDDLAWPTSPALSHFETAWVMTEAGLEFAWNKYDIAAGVIGTPSTAIPWTEPALVGILNPSGPAAEFLS